MGACGSNDNTNTDSAVETAKREEKINDTDEKQSLINGHSSSPLKITMSDLWSKDPRQRASYKSFPNSKTYKLKSDFELATLFNFSFVNELVKLMVGNNYITSIGNPSYGTRPIDGSSKLWIGNGIDTSNANQGIDPQSAGTKFERRLIFETLDTYPVVNPKRTDPPAVVNIPNAQFLIGVSTRYSSRISNKDGTILSGFVIDDACGYWLFDITNLSPSTTSIDTYLLLSNYHGLTTLYSGKLTPVVSNGVLQSCSASLSAGVDSSITNPYSSLLNVSGLSYTQHLNPFNSLATYSNGNEWTLHATFDFTNNTFSYIRKKSAHPANITFTGSLSENETITTPLYGIDPNKIFTLESSVPNDYIISINCAQFTLGNATCVSIIQVTYKYDGVKTVQGSKGKLDPSQEFSSDNGFNKIQVRSGSYIDNLTFTSATDNTIKSYGGNGGGLNPLQPANAIDMLFRNKIPIKSIEPDLRLIGISGTYNEVIQQARFVFAPVYFSS